MSPPPNILWIITDEQRAGIFYEIGEPDPAVVAARGVHLSRQLLEEVVATSSSSELQLLLRRRACG